MKNPVLFGLTTGLLFLQLFGLPDHAWATDHSGTISASETWTAADNPHIVTGNLSVQGAGCPTLTIEPGAEVYFDAGTYLRVGYSDCGELVAQGTSGSPILFTSNAPAPAPGDWQSIQFYGNSLDSSILDYCTVAFGGYGGSLENIYVTNSSPTITHCTVQNSADYGIRVASNSSPEISHSTIDSNTSYGVYFWDNTWPVNFTGNTLSDNGSYAVRIYGDYVGYLLAGNTWTGNTPNAVEVASDYITADATWVSLGTDAYYVINSYLQIQGADAPVMTLEPGVELRFAAGGYINVGYGSWGGLIAEGTPAEPILFTSSAPLPSPGDWKAIRFYHRTLDDSRLVHCTVEYGGSGTDNIWIEWSSPTLSHCTVRYGAHDGIRVNIGAYPEISDSLIDSNAGYGIYFYDKAWPVNFTGNTISNNNAYPLRIYGDFVATLLPGNVYFGNGPGTPDPDSIEVMGDTVTLSGTWLDQGVPYVINGNLYVEGTGRPVLTLEPGVELRFNTGNYLRVGYNSYGGLIADGTGSRRIRFTSNQSFQGPGQWGGIRFHDYSLSSASLLDHCIVEYATDGIYTDWASPYLAYNTIHLNDQGINLTSYSIVTVENNTIHQNNQEGIHAASSLLFMKNNIITSNGESGAWGDTNSLLLVDYNDIWNNTGCQISFDGGLTCADPLVTGTGNLSQDPLFTNAPNADYHLAIGSGCVDAGDPATVDPGTISRADMGAYPLVGAINLADPADGVILQSSPTFSWGADSCDKYVVEFSYDSAFTTILYASSPLSTLSWPMGSLWNSVPVGQTIYWRVRGVNSVLLPLDPPDIVTSEEVWSFTKE